MDNWPGLAPAMAAQTGIGMTRKTFIHRLILAPLAAGVGAVVGKKLPPIDRASLADVYAVIDLKQTPFIGYSQCVSYTSGSNVAWFHDGLKDIEEGRVYPMEEVFEELGI